MKWAVAGLLLVAGSAWATEGPWGCQHLERWDSYRLQYSTWPATPFSAFPDKDSCQDFSEALNEAHERRTQVWHYKDYIDSTTWDKINRPEVDCAADKCGGSQ